LSYTRARGINYHAVTSASTAIRAAGLAGGTTSAAAAAFAGRAP